MIDFNKIAGKWQKKWESSKIFEADADRRKKKFFAHFTYPYVNAYPHIGHFYTLMQADIMARFRRLQGYNVLMPQGWHATGSPIVSAAKRVEEREEKQIKILADMGIKEAAELKKFEEPEYWVKFFAPEFKKDFETIGISIDWRRNYITTSLNQYYDKFIKWQFSKLKEKNYVVKGKFPVVWCIKDNAPVGDHDRVEGEGETPQEFVMMKYKYSDKGGDFFIATATLRPETVFGDTNVWINPNVVYVSAKVNREKWIISRECAEKLKHQSMEVSVISEIKGTELIGKKCKAPVTGRELLILPSSICDPNIATGIVRSVPSHAPFDWAALNDLQNNREECKRYNLNFDEIKNIKPISVIKLEGMEHPAIEAAKKFGVESQNDKELLDKATQEVYKKEFFSGIMLPSSGKYGGLAVAKAKEMVKQDMIEKNEAALMYELTGKVVCRCLTPSIIKIVSDQWFIAYGNNSWKKEAHKALSKLKIYPDKSRQQIENAIDWLRNWACTREEGLGTRLPWDNKWLIESLSDSTIYFAFYTISHLITEEKPENIDDNVFDYVFLGKGKKPKIKNIERMREEFDYWYPVDFNTSGKDLIQNHISFSLFNHSAIFPEDKWMAGIRINGWVTINGQKMSKSLGNIILLRHIARDFSPDPARLTVSFSGESLDDPNWDSEFAKSAKEKLSSLYDFCMDNYNKGRTDYGYFEKWFESRLNDSIKTTTEFMEQALFRSSIQSGFFELQRIIKKYVSMKDNKPNKKLISKAIEAQIIMLSPFAPFICEEIWEKIGKKGFASTASWPDFDEKKIDKEAEAYVEFADNVRKDVSEVIALSKIKTPKKITLIVADKWKFDFVKNLKKEMASTRNPSDIIKSLMKTGLKSYGNEIAKLIPKLISDESKIPQIILEQDVEIESLNTFKEKIKSEIGCSIEVIIAENSKIEKARQAMPFKPAIFVE